MSKIEEMLFIDEGFRAKPYYDTEGYPTWGIGQRIGAKNEPLSHFPGSVTLDEAKAFTKARCELNGRLLAKNGHMAEALAQCNDARRDALLNMAYQLGVGAYGVNGLLGFKRMIAAVAAQDWPEAYKEGKASRWYGQTPNRAERVLQTLFRGDYTAYKF